MVLTNNLNMRPRRTIMSGNTALLMQNREPRFKVRLAIYYGRDQQRRMTDYAVNLGTGGIFIETDNVLSVDTPVIAEFMLPLNDSPITCNSRVAWTNEPGDLKSSNLPPGMGLQFLDLSLENIRAIRDYINRRGLVPIW
jgi:uncharacterized protein (TIGR02266 family)